jgi:hypothetical protein
LSFFEDTEEMFILFLSNEHLQSKQVRVTFDKNDESNERYESTFAAYLEV